MNGVSGSENYAASRSESQTDQAMSRNFEARLPFRRKLDDAAFTSQRSSDVQIAVHVESEPLGTSQPAIEHFDFAVWRHAMHYVEARGSRAGDI